MNPLARRGFTQNWLNRFLYPNSRHLPKSSTSPCGGVLLFIVDGEGFEPISNETCRWHVSATSSKTGGYHHVCEANMQIKSLHLRIVRHLDCRALSCSRRMAACVIAAGPRPALHAFSHSIRRIALLCRGRRLRRPGTSIRSTEFHRRGDHQSSETRSVTGGGRG